MTGAGPGAPFGPHVRGFDYDAAQVAAIPKISFFAYATLRFGVNAASGDVDRDGRDEMLTGPGPGPTFGAQLRGFDNASGAPVAMPGINANVFPGDLLGLAVGSGDANADADDEIVCAKGPGPSNDSTLAALDYAASTLSELPGSRFAPFAGPTGGARTCFIQWRDRDRAAELLVSRGPVPASTTQIAVRDDAGAGFAALAAFTPYRLLTHGSNPAAIGAGF